MDFSAAATIFGLPNNVIGDPDSAVVAIDHAERVTYLNEVAERLYACSASRAIGRPLNDLYLYEWIAPDDAVDAFAALAATGMWQGRNLHILPDGRRITVDSTVRVVNSHDTSPGMVAIIRPVTIA